MIRKIIIIVLFSISSVFAKKKKVACIGDSITWGTNITERERNCYPSYLQYLLGENYDVQNFGVSGATLLSNGDYPYTKLLTFQNALKFKADIIVIMLGTNDSKVNNMKHIDDFEKDYKYLISRCRKSNPKAQIVLMTPILIPNPQGGYKSNMENKIIPIIQKVAQLEKLPLIDMQTPFIEKLKDKKTAVRIPDGIHPNSFGAELIAKEVYKEITGSKQPNFATYALPSMEYRGSAAGWGGGTWWNQLENINNLIKEQKDSIDLVLFGDSITQNWTGSKKRKSNANGKRPVDQILSKYGAISAGISGDRVETLSYRAEQHFKKFKPKYLSIMIGVNNFLYKANNGKEVGEGIVTLIHKLKKLTPTTEIILFATFPNGRTKANRKETQDIHRLIAPLGKLDKVHYVDLTPELLTSNGSLNPKYFGKDGIHPKKGPTYLMWAKKIDETIQKINTSK